MIGIQLSDCGSYPCDIPELEPPDDFYRLIKRIEVKEQGESGDLLYLQEEHLLGCDYYGDIAGTAKKFETMDNVSGSSFGNTIKLDGAAKTEIIWKYSSKTAVFGTVLNISANVRRGEGGPILGTTKTWVANRYTYVHDTGQMDSIASQYTSAPYETHYSAYSGVARCTPEVVTTNADTLFMGPVSTQAITGSTFQFYYLPLCTANLTGLSIGLKAAGIAAGPWKYSCNGSSVTIENQSGIYSFTFSGPLSSVATSIAAANGSTLFTCSYGGGWSLTLVSGVTVATTSDLLAIEPTQFKNCGHKFYVLTRGSPLSPSGVSGGPFVPSFSTSVANGDYPDTKQGYLDWLTAERKPKPPANGFFDSITIPTRSVSSVNLNSAPGGGSWEWVVGSSDLSYTYQYTFGIDPFEQPTAIKTIFPLPVLLFVSCIPLGNPDIYCCDPPIDCTGSPWGGQVFVTYDFPPPSSTAIPPVTMTWTISLKGVWKFEAA
jgi:hypothetical protein